MRILYFDVETSGLDFSVDRIIELAFLVVEDGVLVREYDEFVNVGFRVEDRICDLTGISNELLVSEGLDESVVAEDLFSCLESDTLMIAHNCQFDLNFIFELCCRYYDEDVVLECFEGLAWLDSLSVFRDRKGYPHRLENMVEYYGLSCGNFHRAIDDTKALALCVGALNRERNDLVKYVNVFGFNPKYGVQGREFEFIRYVPQEFHRGMVGKDFILPLL